MQKLAALIRISIIGSFMMVGCTQTDMQDLESYTEQVLVRKGGKIPPLPELKPVERYLYQAAESGQRDPFKPYFDIRQTNSKTTKLFNTAYQKNCELRNKHELEKFELDQLRMVGTLGNDADHPEWGLVADSAGTIHRVKLGNYLGKNCGKITNIQLNRIDIQETISQTGSDGESNVTQRLATLALSQGQ